MASLNRPGNHLQRTGKAASSGSRQENSPTVGQNVKNQHQSKTCPSKAKSPQNFKPEKTQNPPAPAASRPASVTSTRGSKVQVKKEPVEPLWGAPKTSTGPGGFPNLGRLKGRHPSLKAPSQLPPIPKLVKKALSIGSVAPEEEDGVRCDLEAVKFEDKDATIKTSTTSAVTNMTGPAGEVYTSNEAAIGSLTDASTPDEPLTASRPTYGGKQSPPPSATPSHDRSPLVRPGARQPTPPSEATAAVQPAATKGPHPESPFKRPRPPRPSNLSNTYPQVTTYVGESTSSMYLYDGNSTAGTAANTNELVTQHDTQTAPVPVATAAPQDALEAVRGVGDTVNPPASHRDPGSHDDGAGGTITVEAQGRSSNSSNMYPQVSTYIGESTSSMYLNDGISTVGTAAHTKELVTTNDAPEPVASAATPDALAAVRVAGGGQESVK